MATIDQSNRVRLPRHWRDCKRTTRDRVDKGKRVVGVGRDAGHMADAANKIVEMSAPPLVCGPWGGADSGASCCAARQGRVRLGEFLGAHGTHANRKNWQPRGAGRNGAGRLPKRHAIGVREAALVIHATFDNNRNPIMDQGRCRCGGLDVAGFISHGQVASARPWNSLVLTVSNADLVQDMWLTIDHDTPSQGPSPVPGVLDEHHLHVAPIDNLSNIGVSVELVQRDAFIGHGAADIGADNGKDAGRVSWKPVGIEGVVRVGLLKEDAVGIVKEAHTLTIAHNGGIHQDARGHEHGLARLIAMIWP